VTGWRPQPTWRLWRSPTAALDLTSRVLSWDVAYGCWWDAGSGLWTLQTATGSLVLDNRDGRIAVGGLLTVDDLRVPQLVTLSAGASGPTWWQGLASPAGSPSLRGDDTVTWPLHGYYWALVRGWLGWRQTDNGPVGSTPAEVCRRVLRDALGQRAAAPALNVVSKSSAYPPEIRLRDTTLASTGGDAWTRLAHVLAAIPVEDADGRLGVSAMSQMATGRDTSYPDALRPMDDSQIVSQSISAVYDVEVQAKSYTAQTAEVLVTTPTGGSTRSVSARYDFPDDTIGVTWTAAAPTAAAGWTLIDWSAYPAPDQTRADIVRAVIRRDVSSAQPSGVRFSGTRLARAGADTIAEVPAGVTARLGQARTLTLPPWTDPTEGDLTDQHALNAYRNQPKNHARLIYPLWAASASEQLPARRTARTGMLVPGSMSRYPIRAGYALDLITGLVHLSGTSETVPMAAVDGWSYDGSGAAGDWSDVLTGLPEGATAIPSPWTVPTQPDPVFDPVPPAPTLSVSGLTVTISWPGRLGAVDIARAPSGERGSEVKVIQSNVTQAPGVPITDMPGEGTWDYRIRNPAGAEGLWGPWATATAEPVPEPVSPATVTVDVPGTGNYYSSLTCAGSPINAPRVIPIIADGMWLATMFVTPDTTPFTSAMMMDGPPTTLGYTVTFDGRTVTRALAAPEIYDGAAAGAMRWDGHCGAPIYSDAVTGYLGNFESSVHVVPSRMTVTLQWTGTITARRWPPAAVGLGGCG